MNRNNLIILGGGLAGLSLALQLKQRKPSQEITVIEHRQFPMPLAAHKVGESTVEISAYYFAETLGQQAHLDQQQLPKFGLRLFHRGGQPLEELAQYNEIGASKPLPIPPTYQLDRGAFENHLFDTVTQLGVEVIDGATIRDIDALSNIKQVSIKAHGQEQTLSTKYLVDSTGRRGLLRNKLQLDKPIKHRNHAAWFRIEGELNLDDWSEDQAWRDRVMDAPRRLSTNHFLGPGYWIWIIPLASNATSVGIVFDPRLIDMNRVNNFERFCEFMVTEHPLLHRHLKQRRCLDFHVMEDYARDCKQVFSDEGWHISGDAGMFSDPFYSPGADFIAISNTFLTDLIACDDPTSGKVKTYQLYYQSFFTSTLSLYRDQYVGFGDFDLMATKVVWDYCYYWGILAKLVCAQTITNIPVMQNLQPSFLKTASLNNSIQRAFRRRAARGLRVGGDGQFIDHYKVPWFHDLKGDLAKGPGGNVEEVINANTARLQILGESIKARLANDKPFTMSQLAGLH